MHMTKLQRLRECDFKIFFFMPNVTILGSWRNIRVETEQFFLGLPLVTFIQWLSAFVFFFCLTTVASLLQSKH